MGEMMSRHNGEDDGSKFVKESVTSGYIPKKPGEDYVADVDKAMAMANAEKPYRDEKADLKKKIPSIPPTPKEPTAFSKFTGIGMAKHEQAVSERKQASEEQYRVIMDEIIPKERELEEEAKEAAEKAATEYDKWGRPVSVSLPPRAEAGVRYASLPEQKTSMKSARLPDKDGN